MFEVFDKGRMDAYQDRCENTPFLSIGGKLSRTSPKRPEWVSENDWPEYITGYKYCCEEMFGSNWETCHFHWKPALTINPMERKGKPCLD